MKKWITLLAVSAMGLAYAQDASVAVFVKNQTKVQGMDDLVDGLRDRLSAELANVGLTVIDKTDVADSFERAKITTAEERAGLVDGVFKGGSVTRMAEVLDCDYIFLASIVSATSSDRTLGGKPTTTFTLRMTTKVVESVKGKSIFGDNWTGNVPAPTAQAKGDPLGYHNNLFDRWVEAIGKKVGEKYEDWKPVDRAKSFVSFSVSTTIDELINGLEEGIRAPNELLDEMRRVVGGVTVELDGLALGSSPGTFKASPGIHQLKLSRQWMKPWQQTVQIQEGSAFNVALELSTEGLAKYATMEAFRSIIAVNYAEAAMRKEIKVNFDTSAWQDVNVTQENIHIGK